MVLANQVHLRRVLYRVTRSIAKFHWAVSKLPASRLATIGALRDNPAAFADPYAELQNILLRSAAAQKATACWTTQALGSNNKPSVLMDRLIAIKPDSLG
jgi:hypothetical protein